MLRVAALLGLLALTTLTAFSGRSEAEHVVPPAYLGRAIASPQQVAARPNIIVIETDDQRWDTLDVMPAVQQFAAQGITFTNSFATTSLCCPSRASFLTGLYAHNHGIWRNEPPDGGVESFDDASTLATWLQDAGYRTALIGKYFNGYADRVSPFIPPGWADWHVFINPRYKRFSLNDNGTINFYRRYSTDVLRAKARAFIDAAPQPFFLWFTPLAPHANDRYPNPPLIPRRHADTCGGLPPYRPPSFNEANVSDKPLAIQSTHLLTPTEIAEVDMFREKQLCSLKAVDEAVAGILAELGPLSNSTIVIFTSDNGFLWGEHRLTGKHRHYEESVRVPLIIRYPPLISPGRVSDQLVANIDLAPTLAELAGIAVPAGINGRSLVALFSDGGDGWRDDILLEHAVGESDRAFAVRTERYKYVELPTGEREFYDLLIDPYEIQSRADDPAYSAIIATLAARLAALKLE